MTQQVFIPGLSLHLYAQLCIWNKMFPLNKPKRYRQQVGVTFDPDKLRRIRAFVEARKGNNLSAWLEEVALRDPEFQKFEATQASS